MSRRVVLDTSTLVSAALRTDSIPHQALLEAFRSWDVCTSEETLAELGRVLEREKFDRYLPRRRRLEFVALIRRRSPVFAVEEAHVQAVRPPCRDPLDDKFLALALSAEADVVISSDEELLVLHPWRGIPIVTPMGFLSWLGRSPEVPA